MRSPYWIEAEDWHTAGTTVAKRRLSIIQTPGHPPDTLRRTLYHEPRGHVDMYGGFITRPDDPGADFGVLFFHKDGFATTCGHGTIALGHWAVSKGLVRAPAEDGTVDVVVDLPSGHVVASVTVREGKPIHADFINFPSYQLASHIPIKLLSRRSVSDVDLAYSGAVFAAVDTSSQLEIETKPENVGEFIKLGREVKALVQQESRNKDFNRLYGVIFFHTGSDAEHGSTAYRETNVIIFADGQVDRSRCSAGTCARFAILLAQRKLGLGMTMSFHRSIVGTEFEGYIVSEEAGVTEGFPVCTPRV